MRRRTQSGEDTSVRELNSFVEDSGKGKLDGGKSKSRRRTHWRLRRALGGRLRLGFQGVRVDPPDPKAPGLQAVALGEAVPLTQTEGLGRASPMHNETIHDLSSLVSGLRLLSRIRSARRNAVLRFHNHDFLADARKPASGGRLRLGAQGVRVNPQNPNAPGLQAVPPAKRTPHARRSRKMNSVRPR